MSASERRRVVEYLEETQAGLLRAVEEFPAEFFATVPAVGCWSAADTLEHILFVEGRALGRIKGAVQEPVDASRKSDLEGRDEDLFAMVRERSKRVESPAFAQPAGGKSREALVAGFQSARAATIAFARETEADLRGHFAAHPLFGVLDCYQWLMLIPSHGERHRKQIEECREPSVLLD